MTDDAPLLDDDDRPVQFVLKERYDALAERVDAAEKLAEVWKDKAHTWIEQQERITAGWTRACHEAERRADALHRALRERVIQPVWGPDLTSRVGQLCVLCGGEIMHGGYTEPPHAEGCLAAPSAPKEG